MHGLASLVPALPILVVAWRLRMLVRAFKALGALSPDSAVPATSLNVRRGAIFRRLIRRGVIIESSGDRYYLDQARYQTWRSTRRKRALISLSALFALIAIAWLAGWLAP
jgi:hypothetical protein